MVVKDRTYLCFSILILFSVIVITTGQNFWKITQHEDKKPDNKRDKIIWCTVSWAEQRKCYHFAQANERDKFKVYDKITNRQETIAIECKQASNKAECMQLLDEEKATMTTLDAGAVFNGGRYHSLVPIAQEVLQGGFRHYYAVAVIKKDTLFDVNSLYNLRGKKACFAGVETFAGWVLPINTLMKEGGMEIVDCNNHVKSATKYFGPSCAVNCLTDKYNPIGDNSDKLCKICIGKIPGGRCTDADPYAGYEGAFKCLLEVGDVAFVKHNTVPELLAGMKFAGLTNAGFELLCKDGTRRALNDHLSCNWGKVPSDAIVTSSAVSFNDRYRFQKFLEQFSQHYSKTGNFSGEPNRNNFDVPDNREQVDQYGNPINPEVDQYGNRIQLQYDQYGNRINRFKRQTFGSFGGGDNRQPDNRYGQQQDGRDTYRSDGNLYNQDSNRYGQNDGNRYSQDGNRYGQDNRDPNIPRDNNDPFERDPQTFNREQYGDNIDPYDFRKYNTDQDRDNYDNNNYDRPNDNQFNRTLYEDFNMFDSARYNSRFNLLFQDQTRFIAPVNENMQTYANFLGESMDIIMGVRDCPVNRMTLCVTSDAEKNKCVKMRTALKAQLLKPEMDCYKGHSQIHCMQAIRAGTADVTVLDASDVYTAGLNYDLVPFISEVYNLDEPEYYVVAVGKESDPSTELTYLRGKYTCHGGINTAAGWVYPLAFLLSNGWIRPYGCNSIRAAAEYFTKSCVPGALSTEYNTGVPYDNMCDLCHGPSYRYCRRDASEDYYGHTGAFRCLVEGGGHVAFVKHTTVTENTGGKKREWWARDNLNDDFELMCPDGTRAEINEYKKCNLGKVKANAIVTRGGYGYNETHVNAFINVFMYAQTFYGRKSTDEFSFSMFYSTPPYSDLIFQDATTQLQVIEPSKRFYSDYLGKDFMRARRIVDCKAGGVSLSASILTLVISAIFTMFIRY